MSGEGFAVVTVEWWRSMMRPGFWFVSFRGGNEWLEGESGHAVVDDFGNLVRVS